MSNEASDIFNALGDPTRRTLFETLARRGESNVKTLTETVHVSQPMVSRHLSILRTVGLLAARKEGRETFVSVRLEGLLPLSDWMKVQEDFWTGRLNMLDDLLSRMDN